MENENPKYLFSLIPTKRSFNSTRNIHNILLLNKKYNFFTNFFFQSTITKWNNIDPHLRKSKSFLVFKSNIFKFIRPSLNSVWEIPRGICIITRLRLNLIHLRERANLNMLNSLRPLDSLSQSDNSNILNATIDFILSNKRIDE